MLKLKLQNFGHLMQRDDSLEKTLMLGKTDGRRRATEDKMVGWHHQLNGHKSEQVLGDGERLGRLACCKSIGSQRVMFLLLLLMRMLLCVALN